MTASHKTAATVVVLLLACVLQGLCQEQKQGEGFKCPEEFGYYPHPNDCSQYYVCVFGGALLESCTGGLMYSHELQTCDWPRNVGCGAETTAAQPDNQENALALARSSDRQRHPSAQPQRATPSIFNQHHQVQDQQVNEQLVKQQQLYEEEDFRAIEDDSDRQQRVYRGQPSTLGQVARDRDGISKHRNIIPQFAGVEKNKQFQIPNQNYRPQQISVPSYAVEQTVQPITTAKTTTSSSNRNETQYDPAFYSIYDDDSEIYKDVDYGQFTLSSVNNNNNRLPAKPQHQPQIQPQPQLQLQSQPQQDTFRVAAPLQQPTQRYQANTYVPEYNLKITEEEAQREQQTKATYRSTVVGVSPFVPDRSKFKFPEQTSSPLRFTFPTSTPTTFTLPSTTLSTILSYPSTPSLYLRPPSPQGSYFWTTTSTTQKSKPTPPDFRIIVDPYNTTQYDVTTHRGTVKTTPFKIRTTQAPTTTSTTPSTTTTTSTTTIRSVDFDQEYDVVVEDEGTGYIDDNSVEKTSTTSSTTKAPLRSSEIKNTNDYPRVKSGPSIQPVTVPAPTSKTVTECRECNEKPSRGRVRGGATYTTASSNDIDRGTPSVGRTRPTLKPSTSIVSKASEFVDVYKYAPARPDPIYPTPQPDKTAAKCRKDVCQLPDCSCGGKEIPGDLAPEETPQIVLLTFDDSVNDLNKGLYTDLFEKGRVNPNGCPISATFYVSHEWTDYSQVQNLYAAGHEIASHSVSHSFGEQFSQKKWTKEIVGQREILSAYGGVRQEDIRGMRAPFLAVGGNKMFKMLYDSNFTYDSSMPIYENKPPSWPYTLDYKLFHDCMIPPCPTRSYPGVWEVPMVMWQDLNGGRCSMGDACSNPSDADGVQKMLMKNFDRHFTSNRAPFGLFYHAAWFTQPHHKEGFIKFLDNIVSMPEVWIVTNWQAIQWVRDPTSISRLQSFTPFHCDLSERPKKCNNPKVCNLWHKSGVRYMRTCQPCPDIYPWTGKTGIRSSRIDDGSE
ncbi:unnamed protein product [Aphis gossypii]|uniref:Chitin-binding type-2 domain-containing protein n=1 Tax=Aphis gossypii TaxID=80765 RepID=A0A9P0JBH5_APHGO|nr:unnamed protein product [Aphis gossypii]